MHEVSLCESIVRIVQRQAEAEGFSRVRRITLTVGSYSGASTEAMAFSFPFVAKGTVAEGADLTFITHAGRDLKVSSIEVEG